MDRRTFLKSAPLGALTLGGAVLQTQALTLGAPAFVTAPTRDLVLSTPFAPSAGGLSDEALRLARRIERAFEGRVRVRLETVGGGGIEALGRGLSDLHFATEHANVAHEPAFAAFASSPGHSPAERDAFARWIERGNGGELFERCAAAFGIVPLVASNSGETSGLWSPRPITTFNGLKVAADGVGAGIAKGLGAEVVNLGHDEIVGAIRSGAIDAAEAVSLEDAVATGLTQQAPCCLSPGLLQGGSLLSLSVRRALWDDLGHEGQARLRALTRAHYRATTAAEASNRDALMRLVKNVHGVRVSAAHGGMLATLVRVREAVEADLASRSPLARQVTRQLRACRTGGATQARADAKTLPDLAEISA